MSRDIVVHYDEAGGKIVVSTIEHSLTAPLLLKALPLESLIDTFKAKSPDEAERVLGASIFALLDLSSHTKIGIRDYSETSAEWEDEIADELKSKAAAGDVTAQFELAMEAITEGLRMKSRKRMDEADALLKRAVAGGNAEAVEYFANLWPALKERSDRNFE